MDRFVYPTPVVIGLVLAYSIQASEDTIGPKGINSIATGLNGLGAAIGQVEPGRPGKHGYDTEENCCNASVVPFEVYARTEEADVNEGITEHALWVASIMISSQNTVGQPGGVSPPLGLAPQALLLSSAFLEDQPLVNIQEDAALSAQALVDIVFATNMSFGLPTEGFLLDGTSTLTSFVDWSSFWQEVLYVVAGNEIGKTDPLPTDNFNGITVAASRRAEDDFFRRVSNANVYDENLDAVGERTSTDILAPGSAIDVAGANGMLPSRFDSTGTSFAAPHVTGTIALLHQQAFGIDSRRHQTGKPQNLVPRAMKVRLG